MDRNELRREFERAISFCDDREMRLFLETCEWSDKFECYENNTHDIDLEYYADRLNGAWFMFQELKG